MQLPKEENALKKESIMAVRSELKIPSLGITVWHPLASLVMGFTICSPYPFELPHDKTNKITCAPSEDSDQPGLIISLCCPHEETLGPYLPIEYTVMPRLIRVFAGHTSFC